MILELDRLWLRVFFGQFFSGEVKLEDYYAILGVNKGASLKEIKKAYKEMVKSWHPDFHPNNPDCLKQIKDINEAYEVLGDPEKKKAYDRQTGEDRLADGEEDGLHPTPFEDPFLSYFFKVKERLGRKTEKR